MKKRNTLLILTLCFAFILTTTMVNTVCEINPLGHHEKDLENK